MPSHNDLPSDLSRKKLSKALVRLGFEVDKRGGDGSHYNLMSIIFPREAIKLFVQIKK